LRKLSNTISTRVDFQTKLAVETEDLKLDPKELEKGIMDLLDDLSQGSKPLYPPDTRQRTSVSWWLEILRMFPNDLNWARF
jgi:hypothetical protein